MLAAICGVYIGIWVFQHFKIYIPLNDQAVNIALQEPLQAKVKIHDALDANVQGNINATVPIKETLSVPIKQTLNPHAYFENSVLIKTVIPVRETLNIDQNLPVDTHVTVKVLGKNITLPLKGDIPLKLNVPISIDVPLEQKAQVKFDFPVKAVVQENLIVPFEADIKANIPVKGHLNAPIQTALEASVDIVKTLPVKIKQGELIIPLDQVAFHKKNSTSTISTDKDKSPPVLETKTVAQDRVN